MAHALTEEACVGDHACCAGGQQPKSTQSDEFTPVGSIPVFANCVSEKGKKHSNQDRKVVLLDTTSSAPALRTLACALSSKPTSASAVNGSSAGSASGPTLGTASPIEQRVPLRLSWFAVYDGHGGSAAADYLTDHLHSNFATALYTHNAIKSAIDKKSAIGMYSVHQSMTVIRRVKQALTWAVCSRTG